MAKKRHLRVFRVFMVAFVFIIAGTFSADLIRRIIYRYMNPYPYKPAVVSVQCRRINRPVKKIYLKDIPEPEEKKYSNMSEVDLDESQIHSGELVEVNNYKPYPEQEMKNAVNLINYRNNYYTLINDTDPVFLNPEPAKALNEMMAEYYKATGRTNFLVYGTTQTYTEAGSYCPEYFPESATGNTVDLAINTGSTVLTYDGLDEEKWIVDNCYRYGYIVRFPAGKSSQTGNEYCPWHLRYVGKVHSAIMHERGYCLEEYLSYIEQFTVDNQLVYNLGGVVYCIYNIKSSGQKTTRAYVPDKIPFTISGDNTDGFIVTSQRF